MFLDAYYKILFISAYLNIYYHANGSSTITNNKFMLIDTAGAQITRFEPSLHAGFPFGVPYKGVVSQTNTNTLSYSSSRTNIIIGSGLTPVTSSDYKLENEITAGITCESTTMSYNFELGKIYSKKTMTNTGAESITINEVGMTANNITASGTKQILVYREVLDTPLVVAPGESFTITLTHSFTMPA